MDAGMDLAASFAAAGRPPLGTAAAPGDVAGARKSAENFASFFITQSLESMFSEVSPNSLFGGGQGETVYRSLMLQEYGKVVSRADGLGIVDAVQREILRLQEAAK